MDVPQFFHALSLQSLVAWLKERGEPSFRARQIIDWAWKRGVNTPCLMTNISQRLQTELSKAFVFEPLVAIQQVASSDEQTSKYLWKLFDGRCVESVLIRAPGRNTVCVSSQVGCKCGCSFCASGKNGFVRNLNAAEIVFQLLAIKKQVEDVGEKITNVVYMGMGEPLENYDEVVSSIRLVSDPEFLGFSPRRITISTVGVVDKILKLAQDDLGVNLALSLHAPNQKLREKLMPYAHRYSLVDILQAVAQFREKTGRDVTYEYVLLSGVNDSPKDAEGLARLLAGSPGVVNLIPYNPVSETPYHRPAKEAVIAFQKVLDKFKVPYTCRFTKGKDIAAACGQLAMQRNENV